MSIALEFICPAFPSYRDSAVMDAGKTIEAILEKWNLLFEQTRVQLNGQPIERGAWASIKPGDGARLTISVMPQGGDLDAGTLRSFASVGSILLGQAIASPFSGVAQWAIRAGVSLAGVWLADTFLPVVSNEPIQSFGFNGAQNRLQQYGVVPKILGKRRIFPPLAAQPVTEVHGDDMYIRAVFLAGYSPLNIHRDTMKIGDRLLSEFDEPPEVQVINGFQEPPFKPPFLFSRDIEEEEQIHELEYAKNNIGRVAEVGETTRDITFGLRAGEAEEVVHLYSKSNCIEFSFDIEFPDGLGQRNGAGGINEHTVEFEIQYRPYSPDTPKRWRPISHPRSYERVYLNAAEYTRDNLFGWLDSLRADLDTRIAELDSFSGSKAEQDEILATYQSHSDQIGTLIAWIGASDYTLTAGEQTIFDNLELTTVAWESLIDNSEAEIGSPDPDFYEDFGEADERIRACYSLLFLATLRLGSSTDYGLIANIEEFQNLQNARISMEDIFGPTGPKEEVIPFTDSRAGLIRETVHFFAPEAGKWEIRIRKATPTSEGDDYYEAARVSRVRSVKTDPFVTDAFLDMTTMIAVRVKATDQLSGNLDRFSVVVESPLYWHNGTSWQGPALVDSSGNTVSRNPVWQYFDVLRHAGATNSQFDTVRGVSIAKWCVDNIFHCDLVIDSETTVQRVIQDILRTAKASPTRRDGIYSIVHDTPATTTAALITQRNARNFQAVKIMRDLPHALRMEFVNPKQDWALDELYVYYDGYDSGTATIIEDIRIPGVLDVPEDKDHEYYSGQVYKLGRYLLAVGRLRPEVFSVEMDFEHLTFERGDRVSITYDVVLWGLLSGRITEINGSDVTLDSGVVIQAATSYQIRFRKSDGSITTATAATASTGLQYTFTITAGIPAGVAVGDLAVLGQEDAVSVDCLVKEIKPLPNESARITLIQESPEVHNAESETIPNYDPNITLPADRELQRPPRPVILDTETGESVLFRDTDGSLASRIMLRVKVPDGSTNAERDAAERVDTIEVQYRPSTSTTKVPRQWLKVGKFPREAAQIPISEVQDNQIYDVRVRAITRGGITSDWSTMFRVLVIGKTSPPPTPSAIKLDKNTLRWSYTATKDHAGFEVRHAQGRGRAWGDLTKMHDNLIKQASFQLDGLVGLQGKHQFAVKAVDTSGNYSVAAANLVIDFGYEDFDVSVYEFVSPAPSTHSWTFFNTIPGDGTIQYSTATANSPDYGMQHNGLGAVSTLSNPFHSSLDAPCWNLNGGGKAWYKNYPEIYIANGTHTPRTSGDDEVPYRDHFQLDVDADVWEFVRRNLNAFLWPEDETDPLWPSDADGDFWPAEADWHPVTDYTLHTADTKWQHAIHFPAQDSATQPTINTSIHNQIVPGIVEVAKSKESGASVTGVLNYALQKTFPRAIQSVVPYLIEDASYPDARFIQLFSADPVGGIQVHIYDETGTKVDGKVDLIIKGY